MYLKTKCNLIKKLKELSHEEADYYPIGGDIIYKTQEYFNSKKLGLPTIGIKIIDIDTGEVCGFIYEQKPDAIEWF